MDEAKGKVKEKAGEITKDPDLETEGEIQQTKGRGKQAWGNVRQAGRKAKEALDPD